MRKFLVAVAVAGGLAAAGQAAAATVTLDQTVDLSAATFGGFSQYTFGSGAFSAFAPLTVNVGDDLRWTVHFQAGQSLTLLNPNQVIGAFATTPGLAVVSDNQTLSFLGLDGLPFGSASAQERVVSGVTGIVNAESGYTGPVTITGLTLDIPLTRFFSSNAASVSVTGVQNLRITDFGVGDAAVPEPASWALMISGFGLAGASLRRRRARASAA